jgi:arginase
MGRIKVLGRMGGSFYLLYPEWQGSGKTPAVQTGALTMARELFPRAPFLTIESPDEEALSSTDGVIGLASIAPRFHDAIARVREAAPDRILTIGGTCGVGAAPVAYLNERYGGDLAVVWLDAHGDLNTPASSPSGNFHGMILRTLLGEGPGAFTRELRRPLRPAQVFLAATRDLDPPEAAFVSREAISVTPPAEFGDPPALAARIRERGFTRVYLHLDLDAINPADFPDTLMRTPGGPSLDEVCAMMRALSAAFTVVGASIVEYVHGNERSLAALRTLIECVQPSFSFSH